MLGGAHTGPASDTFAAVPDVEVFTMELLEGPRTRTIEFSRETGRKARWQPAETAANRGNGASAPGLSGGELDASGLPGGLVLPGAPAEKD